MAYNVKYYKELGLGIRRKRVKMGLTQKQAAKRCGIAQNILSKVELGQGGVNDLNFDRIKKFFSIPENEIHKLRFGGEGIVENVDGLTKKIDLLCSQVEQMQSKLETGALPANIPV
ncbi:unnamed protein product, partial [marine sediment metagenome]